jgi:hypothetical protein
MRAKNRTARPREGLIIGKFMSEISRVAVGFGSRLTSGVHPASWLRLGLAIALTAILFQYGSEAKDKKKVPVAPLPAIVVNAKKIFLSNGGGSNLAYDAFYSKMKEWGKYEIVGSPGEADLIVELSYRVDKGGTRVWSTTNTYDNTTQVHSSEIVDPQVVVTIYDAKTKSSLWSETDHRRLARREKNREKETVNSAERLVNDLKIRVSIPPQP